MGNDVKQLIRSKCCGEFSRARSEYHITLLLSLPAGHRGGEIEIQHLGIEAVPRTLSQVKSCTTKGGRLTAVDMEADLSLEAM